MMLGGREVGRQAGRQQEQLCAGVTQQPAAYLHVQAVSSGAEVATVAGPYTHDFQPVPCLHACLIMHTCSHTCARLCVCVCCGVLQISANYAMQGRKRPDDFRGGERQAGLAVPS